MVVVFNEISQKVHELIDFKLTLCLTYLRFPFFLAFVFEIFDFVMSDDMEMDKGIVLFVEDTYKVKGHVKLNIVSFSFIREVLWL